MDTFRLAWTSAATAALLVGCGGSPAGPVAEPATSTLAAGSARTIESAAAVGCPKSSPLPGGGRVSIDFVDFVFHNGVMFVNGSFVVEPAGALTRPLDVGPTVFVVGCEFSAFTAGGRIAPPRPSEAAAAFLPPGTTVHSVRGYPATCRLAVRRDGRWVPYLAQHEVNRVSTTRVCALHPAGKG